MPAKKDLSQDLPACARRFGEWIEQQNLTYTQVGQRLGVTQAAISNIFNRRQKIGPLLASAIELELGVSKDWLLHGVGSPLRPQQKLSDFQQHCLRLNPTFDPRLTWQTFVQLLRSPLRKGRGIAWADDQFERLAYQLDALGHSEWRSEFESREREVEQLLRQMEPVFVRIANQVPIGSPEHTAILSVLLDATAPDALRLDNVLPAQQAAFAEDFRSFATMRKDLIRMLEAPRELLHFYIETMNQQADAEEEQALKAKRQGRVFVGAPVWHRLHEGRVIEDSLRRQIFDKKLELTQWDLARWEQPSDVMRESLLRKLQTLETELNDLQQQWEGSHGSID
jgi:transcriptional regulator with XRE-family HTH domain